MQREDQKALDDLLAMLDEGSSDTELSVDKDTLVLRQVDLKIRFKKMLPLSKNK